MWQTEQLLWTSPKSKAITGPKIWSNNCEYTIVCIAWRVFWSHWATICLEVRRWGFRPKNSVLTVISVALWDSVNYSHCKTSQRLSGHCPYYTQIAMWHMLPQRAREKRGWLLWTFPSYKTVTVPDNMCSSPGTSLHGRRGILPCILLYQKWPWRHQYSQQIACPWTERSSCCMICIVENEWWKQRSRFKTLPLFSARVCCSSM